MTEDRPPLRKILRRVRPAESALQREREARARYGPPSVGVRKRQHTQVFRIPPIDVVLSAPVFALGCTLVVGFLISPKAAFGQLLVGLILAMVGGTLLLLAYARWAKNRPEDWEF